MQPFYNGNVNDVNAISSICPGNRSHALGLDQVCTNVPYLPCCCGVRVKNLTRSLTLKQPIRNNKQKIPLPNNRGARECCVVSRVKSPSREPDQTRHRKNERPGSKGFRPSTTVAGT